MKAVSRANARLGGVSGRGFHWPTKYEMGSQERKSWATVNETPVLFTKLYLPLTADWAFVDSMSFCKVLSYLEYLQLNIVVEAIKRDRPVMMLASRFVYSMSESILPAT